MVDPLSNLPSFYEMKLVDATRESGRKSLGVILGALLTELQSRVSSSQHSRVMNKLYAFMYRTLKNFREEIHAIIIYAMERQILRSKACATLSESVYGLTRSKISSGKISPLAQVDRTRVAFILAFGPYLKQYLDRLYERFRIILEENRWDESIRCSKYFRLVNKLKNVFVFFYPILHLAYGGLNLSYSFAYLIGKSVYYSPSLHALGLVVRRITLADTEHPGDHSSDTKINLKEKGNTQSDLGMKGIVAATITTALIVGWIGKLLQELRKCRREKISQRIGVHQDNKNIRHRNRLDVQGYDRTRGMLLPPPPQQQLEKNIKYDTISNGLCPICRRERINPVSSSSGHVFCYKCIVLHLKEHGNRCPITGLGCTISQLVRLYESSDINVNK